MTSASAPDSPPNPRQSLWAGERVWMWVLLAFAAFQFWILPARSSLWRDEAATFWTARQGLAGAFASSYYWGGQTVLYDLIAWAAVAWGGAREFVLRLPSMLAMAAAAWTLYRLGVRLFDPEAAMLAALVFLCSEQVAFAGADARPYAVALLFAIASMLWLLRWLETGRARDAAGYVVAGALVIYGHYLFAPVLALEAVYALHVTRKRGPKVFLSLVAAWAAIGLLLLPLLPQFLWLLHTRASHAVGRTPLFGQFMETLVPPVLGVSVLAGVMLAYAIWPGQRPRWEGRGPRLFLVVLWSVFTPLTYFLLAEFTEVKLFVPRYCVSSAPGLALLAGCVIRSLVSGRARLLVAASVTLSAALAFGFSFRHTAEDWRGAMEAVRAEAAGTSMPVLIASPFVESMDTASLSDPRLEDVLFAPLALYPAAGRLVRLPIFTSQALPYVDNVVATELAHQKSFLLVLCAESLDYHPFLAGRLADRGVSYDSLGDFGSISVWLFRLPK